MSAPWFPFYVGDFVRDTMHLSATEIGAYVLLMCHYWERGSLPTDAERLARICKLPLEQWQCNCISLAELFDANWRHKRIEEELAKQAVLSAKRSDAARKSWGDKGKRVHASALRKHRQLQSNYKANHSHNNIPYDLTPVDDEVRVKGARGTKPIGQLSVEALGLMGIRGGGK
jgi:uncharacterized protein YdaU (DUF1376 family)